MIVRPSVAKKYILTSDETSKQIATSGGLQLIALLITAGSSSAAARVYDSANGSAEGTPSKDAILIAANAGESSSFCPARPLPMDKGIYAEIEQGQNFGAELTIVYS